MEARSFFENSPMAEIKVSATPEEWRKVINDIIELEPGNVDAATMDLFNLLDGMGVV
jgi:hypothetical protein